MEHSQRANSVGKHLIFGTSASTRGAFYHNMNLQKSSDPNANRLSLILALQRTSWFDRFWYPIFLIAGIMCLIFIKPFNFELCFAVASMWLYMFSNNLLARGNVIGIILSIISASLYTVVSFYAKVYGEVMINLLLYIPLDVLAVITYKKNVNNKTDEIDVKKLNVKGWLISLGSTILGCGAIFTILYFIPGQAYPLLNALSISLFIIAMIVRNMRYIEFWWFNLLGNVVSIVMWAIVATTSQNALFSLPIAISSLAALLNNIYGILMWRQIYRKSKVDGIVYVKKNIRIQRVIKIRQRYNKALRWDKVAEEKRFKSKLTKDA